MKKFFYRAPYPELDNIEMLAKQMIKSIP